MPAEPAGASTRSVSVSDGGEAEAWVGSVGADLHEWLLDQRWFGIAADELAEVRPLRAQVLRTEWPLLVWLPVRAQRRDGTASIFQVFLGLAPEVPDRVPESAVIGEMTGPDGRAVMAYAALADPVLTLALCRHVAPDLPMHRVQLQPGEQSNTSLVVDSQWIVKVYRHLEDGPNPDVEVTEALGRVGFSQVPVPVAVWRESGADLAVLRRLYRGVVSGAALARTSLDEVLGSRRPPRSTRHDVGDELAGLGEVVARLHVALAEAFGARPLRPEALVSALEADLAASVPAGVPVERCRAAYRRLAAADDLGQATRIHGDLHLDQVLSTRQGWVVLDFEGEPVRPLDDRRRPDSPLRDVAGMLRSFHYTAELALRDHEAGGDDEIDPELRLLADAWEQRAVSSFVAGYTSVEEVHRLLPAERVSRDALVTVFELQKAVYEVGYEAGHRPELVRIPLRGVERILDGTGRGRW